MLKQDSKLHTILSMVSRALQKVLTGLNSVHSLMHTSRMFGKRKIIRPSPGLPLASG